MPNQLTRRSALLSVSITSAGLLLPGCVTRRDDDDVTSDDDDTTIADDDDATGADCAVTGYQTEGPYYPGEPPVRVDITGGRTGVPLTLDLQVVDVNADCAPIAGAEVDVWSADAGGNYSGYDDFGTAGEGWLRGQQVTDAQGRVGFVSIVPGSYPGRSLHVHVKVRADGFDELTSQVYFPDDLAADVLAMPDYTGAPITRVDDDDFYSPETMTEATGDTAAGVAATIVVGLA